MAAKIITESMEIMRKILFLLILKDDNKTPIEKLNAWSENCGPIVLNGNRHANKCTMIDIENKQETLIAKGIFNEKIQKYNKYHPMMK